MAGRGTDIMLGGNAEFLAKADLRRAGMTDELIAEATGFAETDNQDILDARKQFSQAEAKYKEEIRAACSSSVPSATSPGALTTSFVAALVVRVTPARPASSCPWRMTSCACSALSG